MSHTSTRLEQEFIRDHQTMTKRFSQILDALKADDWSTAVEAARKVDCEAGSHLAFEEEELYPHVAEHRGSDYARQLLEEHRIARDAVRFLLRHPDPGKVQPEERMEIIDEIQTGLDHAISCGTLLSHLTVLSDETQRELLARLKRYRSEAGRMTDLTD